MDMNVNKQKKKKSKGHTGIQHRRLTFRKRLPPISDNLGFAVWVVVYGRFNCV